jgi:hypothetical protein
VEWGDIDWNGNFLDIRRSTWRGITGTPKSGKTRRIDMSDRLDGPVPATMAQEVER